MDYHHFHGAQRHRQITQIYNEKEVQEEGNWISVVKGKMQWANVKEGSADNLNAVRSRLILQKKTGSSVEREGMVTWRDTFYQRKCFIFDLCQSCIVRLKCRWQDISIKINNVLWFILIIFFAHSYPTQQAKLCNFGVNYFIFFWWKYSWLHSTKCTLYFNWKRNVPDILYGVVARKKYGTSVQPLIKLVEIILFKYIL